ncbi:MAG: tyrosine-type recombinase/integrase [Ilumatobacter sp.]|uniref:site-specific integrase n=1 Tax=Ilumatobacter sp. TaxID=1967498 RepID=UPI003C70AFC5
MARGSVRKHDGGWGYRIDLGPDPATGKRRQASRQGFATKREAETALRDVTSSMRDGVVPTRSVRTLGDFLDEWLELQRDRLRPTTWHSYGHAVTRIKAGLGRSKLQALAPLQLEHFYAELLASGGRTGKPLSPKTVRNTHTVLRKALADAERLGLVGRNPAAAANPPSDVRVEQSTWSSDELRTFLDSVRADRLHAAFVLLATTGMRRGEVLGLRWSDLDFDGGGLAVSNTLTTVGTGLVTGPPKTSRSRRQIFLDEGTLSVLREHRRQQNEERLSVGPAWNGSVDYVFTDELGEPVHPDAFSRSFRRRVAEVDLPVIRLHDLRHSYATLALKAGVHPKVVSERLGHATIGVTLDLYSHVTPSIARDAADVVASRILGDGDDWHHGRGV